MPDREKVINYAEETLSNVLPDEKDTSGIMVKVGWIREVLALLKEQEDLGTELTNAVELIRKKNERIEKLLKEQKFLVDSDGKITQLPVVVRCKDCKHWYFADNRIPSEQENVCGRNGTVVTPDWFCADGEWKEGR